MTNLLAHFLFVDIFAHDLYEWEGSTTAAAAHHRSFYGAAKCVRARVESGRNIQQGRLINILW